MADYGEKRCQECNHPVAPELDEKIDTGKTVYCEQCGALLTEATVIKTKPRKNLSKHAPPRFGKKEPFTGAYSKTNQKDKKKPSQNESGPSKDALSNNYSQKNSWAKLIESFRDFLSF